MSKLKLKELWSVIRVFQRVYLYPRPLFNTLTIFVTRDCDRCDRGNKCPYCFTSTNKSRKELGLSEIQAVIDKAKKLGIRIVGIYGGEPTRKDYTADIIRYANKAGMLTIIYTDGSFNGISVEEIKNAGINVVSIAIDSISNRRLKNYEEVKQTIKKLMGYGVRIMLNCCIIKENCNEIPAILELATNLRVPITIHLGTDAILDGGISCEMDSCFKKGNPNDIEQIKKIATFLADETRINKSLINKRQYFLLWIDFIEGKELNWTCKPGLCIDSDGSILLCESATQPLTNEDGQILRYPDITINSADSAKIIKKQIQKLAQECTPRCLSCVHMLEYYSNMWQFIKIIRVFLGYV